MKPGAPGRIRTRDAFAEKLIRGTLPRNRT